MFAMFVVTKLQSLCTKVIVPDAFRLDPINCLGLLAAVQMLQLPTKNSHLDHVHLVAVAVAMVMTVLLPRARVSALGRISLDKMHDLSSLRPLPWVSRLLFRRRVWACFLSLSS